MRADPTPRASLIADRIPVAPGVDLAVDRWEPRGDQSAATSTPFLLVHGLASNARMWDGVAGRLAGYGHPVVTVDLRGHGRSAKPDSGYDVPTVAADLARLIMELDLPRPVVAGQSWGGNVVLELAAAHGPLVGGIACVDGGWLDLSAWFPDWEACWKALAPPHLVGRPLAGMEARMRAAHPSWPEAGIAGALANFDVRPDGTIAPWLTRERHQQVLRGMWEHRPPLRYPHVGPPVLLMPVDTGDAEMTSGKRGNVDAAAAALRRAEIRWFTGDHDIHAQRPDEVGDVLHALTESEFFG